MSYKSSSTCVLSACHSLRLSHFESKSATISNRIKSLSTHRWKRMKKKEKKTIASPRQQTRPKYLVSRMRERREMTESKLNHHHLFKSNAIWCVKHTFFITMQWNTIMNSIFVQQTEQPPCCRTNERTAEKAKEREGGRGRVKAVKGQLHL